MGSTVTDPDAGARRRGLRWIGAAVVVALALLLGAFGGGLAGALILGGLAVTVVAGVAAAVSPRLVGVRRRLPAVGIAACGFLVVIGGALAAPATPPAHPSAAPADPPAHTSASQPDTPTTTEPQTSPSPTEDPATQSTPPKPKTTPPTRRPAPKPGPTTRPPSGTALDAATRLPVKGRAPKSGYSRDQYGSGWATVDGCSTRNRILRRDLKPVQVLAGACTVAGGILADPYTGRTVQVTAGHTGRVQIDHVVALSDSWQKGAQQWSESRRVGFANDPLNLLATSAAVNESKGDGDTATWLPPDRSYRCAYVARQVTVKTRYQLWVTAAEKAAMISVLTTCPNQPLVTQAAATRPKDPHATTVAPKSTPPPSTTPGAGGPGLDPRYPTCKAAIRAGYGPYRRGLDPEYNWYRDADHDGVVCEK